MATAFIAASAAARSASSSPVPAKRVYLNCLTFRPRFNDLIFEPRQDPRECQIQGEPEDMAHLVMLTGAQWSNWGTADAMARGRALNRPSDGPPPSYPVSVRLFRIRRGCRARLFYTRAFVQVAGYQGSTLIVTARCRGSVF
jgi:hypothetical protein